MKKKYTLNIANIQISIVTDASPEEVEHIRGLLDRKIREITTKSRCPKTEATLLCAMEFAADRMGMQDQITILEERCDKYEIVLEGLKERTREQTAEIERLRQENAVLRSLVTTGSGAVAPDPISPAAFFAEVADAQAVPAAPASKPAKAAKADKPVKPAKPTDSGEGDSDAPVAELPTETKRTRSSRVGLMFEQLSFDEAD
jgi:hypothetical protein